MNDAKVVVAIIDGAVHVLQKPDNVNLEIRDYDVPDDMEAFVDVSGNRYQEMVWARTILNLAVKRL